MYAVDSYYWKAKVDIWTVVVIWNYNTGVFKVENTATWKSKLLDLWLTHTKFILLEQRADSTKDKPFTFRSLKPLHSSNEALIWKKWIQKSRPTNSSRSIYELGTCAAVRNLKTLHANNSSKWARLDWRDARVIKMSIYCKISWRYEWGWN